MYVPDDDNYIVDGENYAPPRPPQHDEEKKKLPGKVIVLVLVAIVLGVGVYFVSSLFFGGDNKPREDDSFSTTLSVDDPEVKKIYEKATYGRNSGTLNKYLKKQFVSLKDFSNAEKFSYALYGLREKDLEESDEEGQYLISDSRMDELMKAYFGDKVTYLKQGTIPITLGKTLRGGNKLSLTYDVNKEMYTTSVTSTTLSSKTIPVYMAILESASRDDDRTVTLVERVIYITSSQSNNVVSYNVYRDFNHTMLIDSESNVSLADYQKSPISVEDYINQANIITYKFKEKDGEYYFYQSSIQE